MAQVIGTLYDTDGTPAPTNWQVRLMLEEPEGSGTWVMHYKQTTDSNGDFYFPAVAAGSYRVRVQTPPDAATPDYRCWATTPTMLTATGSPVLRDVYATCIYTLGEGCGDGGCCCGELKPPDLKRRHWTMDAADVKALYYGEDTNWRFRAHLGGLAKTYRVIMVAPEGALWVIDRHGKLEQPPGPQGLTGPQYREIPKPTQSEPEPPPADPVREFECPDWYGVPHW